MISTYYHFDVFTSETPIKDVVVKFGVALDSIIDFHAMFSFVRMKVMSSSLNIIIPYR